MVMPEAVPKEAIEFMTRLGGAVTSSLEDLTFEWYWATHPEMMGKFPYQRPHPNLPPYDDLIVAGLAVPPWVIGLLVEEDAKKKGDTKTAELGKSVKEFGEGSLFYSLPMLVHHTGMTFAYPPAAGARGGSPAMREQSRTDVGHRIIKL